MIDKATFPRHKLCGGGITGRSLRTLTDVFGALPGSDGLIFCNSVEFRAFGTDLGIQTGVPTLALGMRHSFDAALVGAALDAGARDYSGRSDSLSIRQDGVTLPDCGITAPVAVAADGVNSPTARQLFGQAFDRNTIGFALEVETHDRTEADRLRIDFGAADWGYGWRFPKPCGTTIGVGGVLSQNADMKAALDRYLASLDIRAAPAPKGQFLPFGDFRAVPGRGRVLLAGDAAGLVDPITGEGIAYALQSGAYAAKAAATALRQGAPDAALHHYRRHLRPIHRNLRQARLLRHLIFQPALRPAFLRSFKASRTLRADYMRLLGGELDYGALMLKLGFRLPRFAWRAATGY